MLHLGVLVLTLMLSAHTAFGQTATDEPQQPSQAVPEKQPTGHATVQPGDPVKDPAPKHYSTSWKSLLKDSFDDYVNFPKRKSTWVILGIGAVTAFGSRWEDDYVESHVVGNKGAERFFVVGKWAGGNYAQASAAVGLWVVGRYVIAPAEDESRTNKYSEIGFDLLRAQMLSQGIVQAMKNVGRRDRPTGECCSFPSGHSAAAFAAASVLERHLGYRGSWPAIIGAFYVGASRLVDRRHFLSDVMFGAAVGTAAGWTVVGRDGGNQYRVQPVPVKDGLMLAVVRTTK